MFKWIVGLCGGLFFCLCGVLLSGCGGAGRIGGELEGCAANGGALVAMLEGVPVVRGVERWELPEFMAESSSVGLAISTRHYMIYSTLRDPLILRQVPVVLESSYRSYCELLGESVEVESSLAVYLFDDREEWESFTREWTGDQSELYLKIGSGAYYFNGACVVYHLGRRANFSVLAHEGWHQFSDQLFYYRLPAWLDEGMATNFEAYRWDQGRFEIDASLNGGRLYGLREALGSGTVFGLSELLQLDPGKVLSLGRSSRDDSGRNPQMSAYYAQVYALVRFLREYRYGYFLSKFRRLLLAGRVGSWPLEADLAREASERGRNPSRRWNMLVGPLVFGHYILAPRQVEQAYLTFCHQLAGGARFEE